MKFASTRFGLSLALLAGLAGCDASSLGLADEGSADTSVGKVEQAITDVPHTDVEKQSIGNCWLYAEATWIESMSLAANPAEPLDLSQSYWTYWHWFDQITNGTPPAKLQTGGFQFLANAIVRDRGLMLESDFLPEDGESEASSRQASALATINEALARGDFASASSKEVRAAFDQAWGLAPEVIAQLDTAFGEDGEQTLRQGADISTTQIIDPAATKVQFTQAGQGAAIEGTVLDAISSWQEVRYPFDVSQRRAFLRRI